MDDIKAFVESLDCQFVLRPIYNTDKRFTFIATRTLQSEVRSVLEMDLTIESLGDSEGIAECVAQFWDFEPADTVDQLTPLITDALCKLEASSGSELRAIESPRVLSSVEYRDIAQQWLHDIAIDPEGISRLRWWHESWWWWEDGAYQQVDEHYIRHMIYSWLSGMQYYNPKQKLELYNATKSRIANIIDPLRYLPEVFLTHNVNMPEWIETPPESQRRLEDMICFNDCAMDVASIFRGRPGRLKTTPRLFSAWQLPYKYDSKAQCPWFLRTLESCLPDEDARALLQEWFGLQLVPDIRQEKMMMLIGKPAAGKGTVLAGMEAMLGARNIASTTFTKLGSSFGLAGLVGKLAAIDGDAQITTRTDSAAALEAVKRISSGDLVPVEPKGVDAITLRLVARFTFATNELPALPDQSSALRRRLLVLYFPHTFAEQADRGLKNRIGAEGPGICRWALAGLRRLRENGDFTIPGVSRRILDNYVASISPVASFVREQCCVDDTLWVPKDELFSAWEAYRSREHLPKISRAVFGLRLQNYAPGVTARQRKYEGIDLLRKQDLRRM